MLRNLPFRLLLALTFAVGQWLAVAHATQHELTAVAKADTCVVCALSHGSGSPAPMPLLPLDLSSRCAMPTTAPVPALPALRTVRTRCRAPPVFQA